MSEKIKVCYILPFYKEGTDTHLFYNYELIKKVAARKEADLFIIVEKCPKLSLGQIKESLGIKSCYVQKFKFPPLRFFELVLKCFKLRSQGYTNFYVHYSYYGALAAKLATWVSSTQVKVFYWNRGMPWLFKRGWFEEKVFRFILRHTILVTGPESLAKEYQKRYGVKEYRVLSNWVDVERFSQSNFPRSEVLQGHAYSPAGELFCSSRRGGTAQCLAKLTPSENSGESARLEFSGKHMILFVHHLSKRKGADLIPKIAKGFNDDVLFVVAGDGPEREKLEKLANDFAGPKAEVFQDFSQRDGGDLPAGRQGLSNSPAGEYAGLEKPAAKAQVKLLGKVPNSEIPELFRAADVFLMPSREEGSPHVILEAMASGVPFVASDVGGVRELVPKELEQFLCPSEDVKCFQDKIKTLLDKNELYSSTRAQCLEYAKKFDIARGVEEFVDLFK